jgi:hypothetical protein
MPLMGKLFARQTRRLDRRGGYARGLRMTPPERLTIDATVAFDFLDPEAERHEHATALFELAERGEVELATAPQGYRLDLTRGRSDKQLREAFEREEVRATRQVARVSEVTYPGADLIVGHYVQGFAEAWDRIARTGRGHLGLPIACTSRRTSWRGETCSSPTTSGSSRCVVG